MKLFGTKSLYPFLMDIPPFLVFQFHGPGIVRAGSLSHCHDLRDTNGTEPSSMLLVTPVLLLLRGLKMAVVKKTNWLLIAELLNVLRDAL